VGWVTEQFGPRVGLVACGLVSAIAAAAVGLVLARIGNLRLRLDWQEHALVFVPRQRERQPRGEVQVVRAS
jgi:hypothetical protein